MPANTRRREYVSGFTGGISVALGGGQGMVWAPASARAREKGSGLHHPEFMARSRQTQNDGEY